MAPDDDGWIPLGRLTRPHGVRGELRLVVGSGSDDAELPEEVQRLRLRPRSGAPKVLEVEGLRGVNGAYLVFFAGVEDRNAAELLAGAEVDIEASALPPLEPGEVYLFELTGAAAFDEAGTALGTVRAVLEGKAQDLLELDTPRGERLLPLAPDTLVRFERAERRVVLRVPQGLWDER